MHRHYLVDQLDRQLVTSRGAAPSLFRAQPPPADATVRLRERRLPSDLFDIYVAQVDTRGAVTNVFVPGVHRFGVPELRGKDLAQLEGHEPTTVASTKSGESYRVSVRRAPDGFAGYVVVGLPLNR